MFLKEFIYHPESGLYVSPAGVPDFSYSDGAEVEDYLLWAISNAGDKSSLSEELRAWIKDWPSRYHLSSSRANLLRPFSFLNNSVDVLEIGSGCGAITRYLGEVCGHVDAIEGSYRRAKITRERCSDLSNVNVYVANVFEVSFDKEYDIAILIGVLEYAPTFCPKEELSKEDCCAELLKRVTCALKDDGILILAIENKLGLKYWTGAKEDHSGKLFDGLYDYPHFPGLPLRPATFSKNELYQLLLSVGFRSVQFYYPFPDYKLPNTLIRDSEELRQGELFLHNWITTPFEDYSGYREYLFHEGLTLKSLHEAGLLGELANSFLVLASKGEISHLIDETWIAKRYSVERKPCYATETTLYCVPELKIVKNRIISSDFSVSHKSPLLLKEKVEQWYPGDLLTYEFYKAILDEEAPESRLKSLVSSLNDFLIKNYGTRLSDEEGYPLLHGRSFDVVPWNIILSEERWIVIDREWEYQEMLPVDFVLYRGLYYFLTSQQPYLARNKGISIKDPDSLIITLIRDVYPTYDEKRHMTNKVWEGQLQDFVAALPFDVRIRQLQLQIEREQLEKQMLLDDKARLEKQVAEKEQKIKELVEMNNCLLANKDMISTKDSIIDDLKRQIALLQQNNASLERQLFSLRNSVSLMENSLGWYIVKRYRALMDGIFPPASFLRKFYIVFQKICKLLVTEGPINFGRKIMYKIERKAFKKNNTNFKIKPIKVSKATFKQDDMIQLNAISKKISVIIPTKNAGSNFKMLLRKLKNQKGIKNIEIIVIDSGSTDNTVKIAQVMGAKVIEIPAESFTHAYSRNLGAKSATGEYLLFMVQDALPLSDTWLYELIKYLEANDLVALSCIEYPRSDSDLFYRFLAWNHYRTLNLDKDRVLVWNKKFKSNLEIRSNAQLSNISCVIRKDIFERYMFQGDYGEDLDLGMRLTKDGHKIGFLSSVKVLHSHNRPAFYFLKRAYVDQKFLTKNFDDIQIPCISNYLILFSNIIVSFKKLACFVEELKNLVLPVEIKMLLKMTRDRLFFQSKGSEECNDIKIEKIGYLDQSLKNFLNKLESVISNINFKELQDQPNIIIEAVKHHFFILEEYMLNIYSLVDEFILNDFVNCLVKIFALQSGAHISYCYIYLQKYGSENDLLREIDNELVKGV